MFTCNDHSSVGFDLMTSNPLGRRLHTQGYENTGKKQRVTELSLAYWILRERVTFVSVTFIMLMKELTQVVT